MVRFSLEREQSGGSVEDGLSPGGNSRTLTSDPER